MTPVGCLLRVFLVGACVPGFAQNIPVPDLACVNATVIVTYEGGHQVVEVDLANNCKKDIVAFGLGLSNSADTTDLSAFRASFDYLHTLRMKLEKSSDRFSTTDIFRSNSKIAVQFRDLQGGLAQPTDAHLTSAIFSDFSAAGDRSQVEERLRYWRADLQNLRRIFNDLNKVPNLEAGRAQFYPGSCVSRTNEQGRGVRAEDGLYAVLCENVVLRANAKNTTPESWNRFIAAYKEHLEKGIRIYLDYTAHVPVGSEMAQDQ